MADLKKKISDLPLGTPDDNSIVPYVDVITNTTKKAYKSDLKGTDGNTILNGVVNPTTEGVDGDFYINTITNYIFGPKTGGVWPIGVHIAGVAGNGISSVVLLNTVGKVKTYRMTFTDTTIFDYVVIDGADGTGTGDMLKSENLSGLTNYATARSNLGISATNTPNTPAGNISSTDIQGALNELDTEKQAKTIIATYIGNSINLETSVSNLDNALQDQKDSGFISWIGSGNYYSYIGATGVFTLLRGGTGRIQAKLISFSGSQSVNLTTDVANYIYINSSGVLSVTSSTTGLYENNIVLFEAYYIASQSIVFVVKENHEYKTETAFSGVLHNLVGTVLRAITSTIDMVRVATGTGGATGDRQIKIVGTDVLEDHGLSTTIPDSAGSPINMFFAYKNAGGLWKSAGSQTEFLMQYNNAGTLTTLTSGNRGIFRIYVAKDDLNSTNPTYFAVMDTSQYGTLGAANTAIANGTPAAQDGEFLKMEAAQVGFIIVRNRTGGYIEGITMARRTLSQNTTSGTLSNNASGILTSTTNFNGILSVTDTNVQIALETIDDFPSAISTITNKRITKRVVATTQSATPAINTDVTDISNITGLAQAITSFTTNLTGFPVDGDLLMINITDNGTARALSWGTSFEASVIALPVTTVSSTLLKVGFQYNGATSKWRCIAIA